LRPHPTSAFAIGRDRKSCRNRDLAGTLFNRARVGPEGLEIVRSGRGAAREGNCLRMMPERTERVPEFEFVEDVGRDG
jgi:hypothetical protein